jgi:hypothetical protein
MTRTSRGSNLERLGMISGSSLSSARTSRGYGNRLGKVGDGTLTGLAYLKPFKSTITKAPSTGFPSFLEAAGSTSRVKDSALTSIDFQCLSGVQTL